MLQLLRLLSSPDLSLEDEASIRATLHALTPDEEAELRATVRALPLERVNPLRDVYEALATVPKRFGDFLAEELHRLFTAALHSRVPERVLAPVEAFSSLMSDFDGPLQRRLREALLPFLDAPVETIRYRATWLIGDFTFGGNRDVIRKLHEMMQRDESWRVRHAAYVAMRQSDSLPPGTVLPLLDRIRVRFLDSAV
ncbi:MAG TPA: hypothetical protein VF190_09870 [Rhodothermales bacterium]